MDPRVVKPQLPARVIVTAAFIGLFVLGFIIFAVWYSGVGISNARMSGIVVGKEFVPQAEQQITLGGQGGVRTSEKDGDYILTVAVPQSDGTKKEFRVWLGKALYDSIKEGDNFDVGPYVVPEKK
ncbi:MAG: hypothetical protein ACOYMS_11500 [Terrimicrobiaceae bacterium]